MLMTIAYLCNNATFDIDKYKGDPTEAAIFKTAREAIGDIKAERIHEIPFDSERKRMSTVNKIEVGKIRSWEDEKTNNLNFITSQPLNFSTSISLSHTPLY